jgi:hypothetical protein
VELCLPQNAFVEALIPVFQNVTVVGYKTFEDINNEKLGC